MDIDNLHEKELGLKTPDDYFEKSKAIILSKTQSRIIPFYKKAIVAWTSVAAIFLLLTFTLFRTYTQSDITQSEDDIFISSLLEDDDKIDDFITQYIEDEILTNESSAE